MCVPVHSGGTTILDILPYADLLSIHNALADKPARRFDTRSNGEKRTLALMEAWGLILEEAARLAGVVLGASDHASSEPPIEEPTDRTEPPPIPAPEAAASDDATTITVGAALAPLVTAFVAELAAPDRPAYLTTFLRRMNGEDRATPAPRERQMTASQKTIVDLCMRPKGATGKELAEGCGWPSIAARATCQKLADRFGYTLSETPRTKERGISFHMTAKPTVEV